MSYDLWLHTREGRPPLERDAFFAYFTGDRWAQQGDEVHYSNQATGVYFHFRYGEPGEDDQDPNTESSAHHGRQYAFFNINFFRPSFFGLEAERELTRLVQHFDFVVSDPQGEGMGNGEYSPEGFLRGWNAGNRFAVGAMRQLRQQGEEPIGGNLSLPQADLRAIWEWTCDREETSEDLRDIEEID